MRLKETVEIEIHHVQFGPDSGIEIAYSEPRDEQDGVLTIRTLIVDPEMVSNELADIFDTIQDIVDKFAPGQNRQPDTLPVR